MAHFNDYSLALGRFSAPAIARASGLHEGLPLSSFASRSALDREIDQLVRRLTQYGLMEYSFAAGGDDVVVIEPQTADYWPRAAKLAATDSIVLSRFAYMRRRGNDIVLESPRANALFRINDPHVTAALTILSIPHTIRELSALSGFPGTDLLGLLVECRILFKVDAADDDGRRASEGDHHLVLWDFHDLLFHARSTEGRHANPLGGVYPHVGHIAPLPAVRTQWDGETIHLDKAAPSEPASAFTELLRARRSSREFDDAHPVTLAELSRLLDTAARISASWDSDLDFGADGPVLSYTSRPYPSGGSAYELELYLAVANCEGLKRGFYHYDAAEHALVALEVEPEQLDAMLMAAAFAMDAGGPPQVLLTVAARFGRISWKYASIAYSLVLKDVGVLLQTLYLTATDMGLGGCAIGTNNIDLFAQMTGLEFHVEGPVGQFALGRGLPQASTSPPGSAG